MASLMCLDNLISAYDKKNWSSFRGWLCAIIASINVVFILVKAHQSY